MAFPSLKIFIENSMAFPSLGMCILNFMTYPASKRSFPISCQGGPEQLIGSVLRSLSCLAQRCGFTPPLQKFFSARGDISLGDSMGSDSIPPKTLLDDSTN